jgi:hypothetical protein
MEALARKDLTAALIPLRFPVAAVNPLGQRPVKGSGQFRVKMHAKPQLIIFQSVRDAKFLWFSCRVFDTLVEASGC